MAWFHILSLRVKKLMRSLLWTVLRLYCLKEFWRCSRFLQLKKNNGHSGDPFLSYQLTFPTFLLECPELWWYQESNLLWFMAIFPNTWSIIPGTWNYCLLELKKKGGNKEKKNTMFRRLCVIPFLNDKHHNIQNPIKDIRQ